MNKVFTDNGWRDYVYWQTEDRKTLKKINNLIEDDNADKVNALAGDVVTLVGDRNRMCKGMK